MSTCFKQKVESGDKRYERSSAQVKSGPSVRFYLLYCISYPLSLICSVYAAGLKPTFSKQAMASSVERKSRNALAASGLALFFMTAAG